MSDFESTFRSSTHRCLAMGQGDTPNTQDGEGDQDGGGDNDDYGDNDGVCLFLWSKVISVYSVNSFLQKHFLLETVHLYLSLFIFIADVFIFPVMYNRLITMLK